MAIAPSPGFAPNYGRPCRAIRIDAQMIAWFAEIFVEAKGQTYDAAQEKLAQIVSARQFLIEMRTRLRNRREHSVPEAVRKMQAQLLKSIALELAKIEAAIAATIKAVPAFAERAAIIESVPG